MTGDWRPIADPGATGDAGRQVLVWHRFQGAMVTRWSARGSNPFHQRWRELPEAWIDTATRRPTAADADIYRCVIVRDAEGFARMLGWRQAEAPYWPQWQPPPAAPGD